VYKKELICDTRSFDDIINTDNSINALENEINILHNKITKEKQFNRKVELNKLILNKKNQLKKIKEEL